MFAELRDRALSVRPIKTEYPMQPDPDSQLPGRESKMTRQLFAVAVLATCGLIMAMDYADPDLWGHVLYGQEILDEGTFPATTTWSFTANGYRWINHENIAELVMAWTVNLFGPLGLTFGKYLFSLILLGIIYWRARVNDVSHAVCAFVCFIIAFSVQFHWHYRPQIFGYLFFGIMCSILFWCFQNISGSQSERATLRLQKIKHLLWLGPLTVLWTNTHGSFAAGVCIAAAYLGLEFVQIYLREVWHKPQQSPATGRARKTLYLLPLIVFAIGTATIINPYGVELHAWLLGALREARPEIGDWESPSLFSGSREVIGLWVMLITTVISFRKSAQKDWAKLIVFLLVATQAISHIRHLPLLAILWGSWFAVDLSRTWSQFLSEMRAKSPSQEPVQATTEWKIQSRPLIAQFVLSLWILTAGIATWPKLATLNVPRDKYPVDALKFMAEHELEGRTVVTFNWAQYAIGFFSNEGLNSTVAFDGRFRTCYPQEVIDIYFDFIFGESYTGPRHRSARSGPVDGELALSYKDPEIFLISKKQKSTVRTMQAHQQDWSLLYEDDLSQVWGHRERIKNIDLVQPTRVSGLSQTDVSAAWPAFATSKPQIQPNPSLVNRD